MSFAEAIVTNDIVRVGRVQNVQTRMAIPSALLNRATASPQKYDVVLSFSGDDRAYVDEVAAGLKKLGVRVFYDRYEEASRWGKDLVEHFDSVYRNDGRYCVMFISKSYAEKMWTRSRAVWNAGASTSSPPVSTMPSLTDSDLPQRTLTCGEPPRPN